MLKPLQSLIFYIKRAPYTAEYLLILEIKDGSAAFTVPNSYNYNLQYPSFLSIVKSLVRQNGQSHLTSSFLYLVLVLQNSSEKSFLDLNIEFKYITASKAWNCLSLFMVLVFKCCHILNCHLQFSLSLYVYIYISGFLKEMMF